MQQLSTKNPCKAATIALACGVVLAACDSDPAAVEDMAPPTITLASPVAISAVQRGEVVVRGTASDDVAVARMTYSLNGGTDQEIVISPDATVDFEFTVPALELGANRITLAAFDEAGNQADGARHVDYAAVRYEVVALGELDEGWSRPGGINASGDVAFTWEPWEGGHDARGLVWSAGALTELTIPDGHVLMGVAGINSSRVAVGELEDVGTGTGDWRDVPVVWENGQPTVLPLLHGYTMGGAVTINDAGVIAGYVMDQTWDNWAAVIWIDGEPTPLATPGGGSVASVINSTDVVTGSFWSGTTERAFRWENGETAVLEPLSNYTGSSGHGINEAGDVVGYSFMTGRAYEAGDTRATLWRGATAISLGEYPGATYYRAWAINSHGHAVGSLFLADEGGAFISDGGRMSLLTHLTGAEWEIVSGSGINDAGQISASAVHVPTGTFRAVRLDPVDGSAAAAGTPSLHSRDGVSLNNGDLDRVRPPTPIDRLRQRRIRR